MLVSELNINSNNNSKQVKNNKILYKKNDLSASFLTKKFVNTYNLKDFNFQFGGVLNFLLMDAYVYDVNFIQEGSMPYHRYDSGLCGGLGFDFSRIQIYFRYYQGVVNINPFRNIWVGNESGSEFFDYTERNKSFQFGIEYRLIKKKKEKQYGRKYAKPH